MSSTDSNSQIAILADLWLNYKNDPEFTDFIEYNDIGLPLAYILANDIAKPTEDSLGFIAETWDLFLQGLEIDEDTGFETLDDVFSYEGEA